MIPIQLHITTAPGTTRRDVFTASPVTFGRAPDNTVVLESSHASRHHGELRFADGGWEILNRSPNGTVINGKRVSGKPRRLRDGDTVAIGETQVFRILLESAAPAGAEPEDDDGHAEAARTPMAKRTKIGIAAGAYFLGLLALMLFLMTLGGRDENGTPEAQEMTPDQIAADIRRPLAEVRDDPRAAAEQLLKAIGYFNDGDPDELYQAYDAFRRSLALSGRPTFADPQHQRQYLTVREDLTKRVTDHYMDAIERLRSNEYRRAADEFRRLNEQVYPDSDSAVFANARSMRQVATHRLKQRRR